jgi:hypothetical protein
MTTYTYAEYPIWQFYNNGEPVAGGQLFCYQAGTTTKQAAYADISGTSISNPIILDSQGRPTTNGTTITPVFLQVGQSYKFVLAASTDTDPPSSPIWTADNQSTTTLITNIANTGFGQCRLSVTNTTTLTLSPYNGNLLTINDTVYQVPNAGVTLSNSGLLAGVIYYIYAYINSGTMTLEASTTAYSAGGTTRMMVKNGDVTRTLVGMVFTNPSVNFVDSTTERYLANWFNRIPKPLQNTFTQNRTTTSATYAEVNTEVRCNFLVWESNETAPNVSMDINASDSASTTITFTIFLDGAQIVPSSFTLTSTTTNLHTGSSHGLLTGVAEGLHHVTIAAATASGTLTLYSSGNSYCQLMVDLII